MFTGVRECKCRRLHGGLGKLENQIRSDHRLDSVFPLLSKGPDDKTNYSADV